MPLDLNNLKTQLKAILDDANTTTATYDLSTGLDTRVQHVLKLNPTLIPVDAEWHPYVTVFTDAVEIEPQDMAGTQLAAKRTGTVTVKIVGSVFNTVVDDPEEDAADEECEKLMKNIEEVLRRNDTLNGAAIWHRPTRVQYYNASLGEGNALRAGVLDLETTVFY